MRFEAYGLEPDTQQSLKRTELALGGHLYLSFLPPCPIIFSGNCMINTHTINILSEKYFV